MGKLTLKPKQLTSEEQLSDIAWDIFNGYSDMPANLTNQEQTTVAAHIERFRTRKANQAKRRAEREKQDVKRAAQVADKHRKMLQAMNAFEVAQYHFSEVMREEDEDAKLNATNEDFKVLLDTRRKERRARLKVAILMERRFILEQEIRLAFRLTSSKDVRKHIEDDTRRMARECEARKETDAWRDCHYDNGCPHSYKVLAADLRWTLEHMQKLIEWLHSRDVAEPTQKQFDKLGKMLNMINCTTAKAAEKSTEAAHNSKWLRKERERCIRKNRDKGRKNQLNGEKNGNGRTTDTRLKNQIMTEVRQIMKRGSFTQSNACKIVAQKHLKADGKTPIFSKRTIENWMSVTPTNKIKRKSKPKKP